MGRKFSFSGCCMVNVSRAFSLIVFFGLASSQVFASGRVLPSGRHLDPLVARVEKHIAQASVHRTRDLTPSHLIPFSLKKAVSAFEMQGLRDSAEDALDIFARNEWIAFGLFDGHGGRNVAAALATHLRKTHLLGALLDLVCSAKSAVTPAQVAAVYAHIDGMFVHHQSGSTAVVCLIDRSRNKGYFINLGDSRGVAIRKDGSFVATVDHSPEKPRESARIRAAGGDVVWNGCWRVDGSLGVSRSFGDFHCKPLVDGKRHYHVGIVPEITAFDLGDVKTIVLACDGVWDVIKNEQVESVLKSAATSPRHKPAEFLCKTASLKGSKDNISAMVIDVAHLPLFKKVGPTPRFKAMETHRHSVRPATAHI